MAHSTRITSCSSRGAPLIAAVALIAGCATQSDQRAPASVPPPVRESTPAPAIPQADTPGAIFVPPATPPGVVVQPVPSPQPAPKAMSTVEGRALVARLLPTIVADRPGWATDIYAALAAMEIAPTPGNVCAVVAITEQESGFHADPQVPGLSRIAWKEIEKQRERSGIPKVVLWGALALPSPNGKSYSTRLDAVKTERELSEIFEDFIGMVPLAKPFLENRNPVRTGGPMQVSIAFAESHAALRPYPYPVQGSIRHEVFRRRGGMYFGIAHLLDYPASYDSYLYRYADFNAGHYASRNAAFQYAVTQASGIPLTLDGDLLRYLDGQAVKEAGATERAVRVLAKRLKMSNAEIRRDLELSRTAEFERSRLYFRLYVLADGVAGKPLPRAMLPRIELKSPKITRKLTTDWFARRVDGRYQTCMARAL
ncbi:MAG TPA: DUF1615 domain-containing protein [Burkholderiales bacterium]|nr:DUF1615 domain-containing protein [Burkholderiales bacterium]